MAVPNGSFLCFLLGAVIDLPLCSGNQAVRRAATANHTGKCWSFNLNSPVASRLPLFFRDLSHLTKLIRPTVNGHVRDMQSIRKHLHCLDAAREWVQEKGCLHWQYRLWQALSGASERSLIY